MNPSEIIPDRFSQLSDSLEAHPSKAQILIQLDSQADALQKVIDLLNSMGVHHVEHTVLSKEAPVCILLYIPEIDISEPVINLIEAGYVKVKGVNAKKRN